LSGGAPGRLPAESAGRRRLAARKRAVSFSRPGRNVGRGIERDGARRAGRPVPRRSRLARPGLVRLPRRAVVRDDPATVLRAGLNWILSVVSGGWLVPPPRSLLDTSPFGTARARHSDRPCAGTGRGRLRPGLAWRPPATRPDERRVLRRGLEHRGMVARAPRRRAALRSTSTSSCELGHPFPSRPRRSTMISTATVRCGSWRRSVPRSTWCEPHPRGRYARRCSCLAADGSIDTPPSPGHLLGFVLDSLFTDGLSIDLERLRQINAVLMRTARQTSRTGGDRSARDQRVTTDGDCPRHLKAMPRSLRTLLRTIGGSRHGRTAGELPAVRVGLHDGTDATGPGRCDRPARGDRVVPALTRGWL